MGAARRLFQQMENQKQNIQNIQSCVNCQTILYIASLQVPPSFPEKYIKKIFKKGLTYIFLHGIINHKEKRKTKKTGVIK